MGTPQDEVIELVVQGTKSAARSLVGAVRRRSVKWWVAVIGLPLLGFSIGSCSRGVDDGAVHRELVTMNDELCECAGYLGARCDPQLTDELLPVGLGSLTALCISIDGHESWISPDKLREALVQELSRQIPIVDDISEPTHGTLHVRFAERFADTVIQSDVVFRVVQGKYFNRKVLDVIGVSSKATDVRALRSSAFDVAFNRAIDRLVDDWNVAHARSP